MTCCIDFTPYSVARDTHTCLYTDRTDRQHRNTGSCSIEATCVTPVWALAEQVETRDMVGLD